MPYTLSRQKKADAPSFNQLYRPIDSAMVGMPPLEARGHKPLKMTFDDQLKLSSISIWKNTFRHSIFFRFLKKMILPETTLRQNRESKRAASLRPSIPGDSSSSCTYTNTSKPRLFLFYQRNMPTLQISLVLTVPSKTSLFFRMKSSTLRRTSCN